MTEAERKACKQRVKAGLRMLRRSKGMRDELSQRWIDAKCARCMACPRFAASRLAVRKLRLSWLVE